MGARELLSVAAWAALCPVVVASRDTPHNVVVIVMDDVGTDLVGCYDAYFQALGRPSGTPARTPAIDQLMAGRGILFTRAWSNPVCSPTRASLLTGRNSSRTGIGNAVQPRGNEINNGLAPTANLLPELLHAAPLAYTCAALGKWHLADPAQLLANPLHPLGEPAGRWFDRYAGALFNFTREVGVPANQTGYFQWDKYYASRIELAVQPCAPAEPPCTVVRSASVPGGYPTVDTADDAIALLQELPEPFFLYVAFNAAHSPYHLVPSGLPTQSCGTYQPPTTPCDPGAGADLPLRARCMLEALDAQIARVLCEVDDGDTTVILLGDNGTPEDVVLPPYTPEHSKRSVYQGGVNVPLIVRSPFIDAALQGTTCDALVGTIDVFATACEIARLDPALTPGVDSLSLVPHLHGLQGSQRTLLYAEYFWPNFIPDPLLGGPPSAHVTDRHDQALRDERFKLIRHWRRDPGTALPFVIEELYDFVAGAVTVPTTNPPTLGPDFLETNDLLAAGAPALSNEAAAALAALRAELDLHHPTLVR